ncbi:MAG: amidohydrolase family protein [Candidatus Aminicenantes bacterium]
MRRFKKLTAWMGVILFSLLVPVFASYAGEENVAQKTILTNCNVIDCTGEPFIEDVTVVIVENRITEIKKGAYSKPSDEKNIKVYDLDGGYVLPGFWNVHMHLAALLPDPNNIVDTETLPSAVMRAALNAMDGLRWGFTGIRTVGEREYLDIALRDIFDAGFLMGPRIFCSGEVVSITGGHRGDVKSGADGVAAVRKAIRERVVHGVDWIKIMGVEMLQDELDTAVETAHHMGLRVASHSKEPATYRSVKAGVDCIEHGYGLKDETIKLMAEKGTFYVPTIICNLSDRYIKERESRLARLGFADDEQVVWGRTVVAYADERSQAHAEHQRQALKKAFEAGVKVCTGSDSTPVGEIGILEIEQFVLSGVSEMNALIAATRNCADLCGVLDKLGTVEEGKLADLVVLSKNPLDNISNIRMVKLVFKDGVEVERSQPYGTLTYWDYYNTKSYRKGYMAKAEEAAGFSRGKVKKRP